MFHHRKNGDKLIQRDGIYYHVKSTTKDGKRYLVCKEANGIFRCPARANLTSSGEFTLTVDHECEQDDNYQLIYEFEESLQAEIRRVSNKKLRSIYDDVAFSYPEASVVCPFSYVEHKMKDWFRECRPPQPHSLADIVQLTNDIHWREKYTHYNGGVMDITMVRGGNNATSIIFMDIELIRSLHLHELLIDATFRVCPRRVNLHQCLTIMAKIDDTYEPIIWVLMERKSVAGYLAVLRYIKEVIGDNCMPRTATVDFERAISTAIRIVFPHCIIKRCYFHYSQALTKRLIKLYGKKAYEKLKEWPRGFLFFRKFIGLALLPATETVQALQNLIDETEQDILLYFDKFCRYYRWWWINRVKPANFSVFDYSERTNNAIESYHRMLNSRMNIHPNIWTFIENLLKLQTITKCEILSIIQGRSVRRSRAPIYFLRDSIIEAAWRMYRQNELNSSRFLAATGHIVGGFGNQFLFTEPAQLRLFVNDLSYSDIVTIFAIPQRQVIEEIIPVIGDNVLILRNLDIHRCILCHAKNIATFVSTPCWHWFSCDSCFNRIINVMAQNENLNVVCNKCGQIVDSFRQFN